MKKPVILIPMGDPAGVGPEIIIKALADPETANGAVCVVIGDKGVLERAMRYPNMPSVPLNLIADPNEASPDPGVLNLIDLHNIDPEWFRVGQVDGRWQGGLRVYRNGHPLRQRAPRRRRRHPADQQGGAESGRRAFYRPHGDFRQADGHARSSDDV